MVKYIQRYYKKVVTNLRDGARKETYLPNNVENNQPRATLGTKFAFYLQ